MAAVEGRLRSIGHRKPVPDGGSQAGGGLVGHTNTPRSVRPGSGYGWGRLYWPPALTKESAGQDGTDMLVASVHCSVSLQISISFGKKPGCRNMDFYPPSAFPLSLKM